MYEVITMPKPYRTLNMFSKEITLFFFFCSARLVEFFYRYTVRTDIHKMGNPA